MRTSLLGKIYQDGDVIVRQGEEGNHMFVIQKGKAEVLRETGGELVQLSVLGDGDIFGEMALFGKASRSATVRAKGEVRVLTIDKKMSQTYFFHPSKNRLLIGTGEIIIEKSPKEYQISTAEMKKIIKNINEIVPGIKLTEKDVLRAYTGILPATEKDILAKREILIDHSKKNGPKGLFSISGVKFTTSRLVADKTIQQLFPGLAKISYRQLIKPQKEEIRFEYNWHPRHNGDLNTLKDIAKNESVLHLSDLMLRRTSLGDNPERAIAMLPKLKKMFSWDNKKWDLEVENLRIELRKRYPGQHSKENKKVEKLLKR